MGDPQQPWRRPESAAIIEGLSVLARHRGFIAVFCSAAIIVSLTLTFVFSERYVATTTVFYRPQEVARLGAKETQAFGSPAPAAPFKVISQTLRDVLASDAVLKPVVLSLNLHQRDAESSGGPWYARIYREARALAREAVADAWTFVRFGRVIEEDPVVSAISRLRSNIRVSNRDSYVFLLSLSDKDPARAAAAVNQVATRLVEWLRELDRKPGEERRAQIEALIAEKTEQVESLRQQMETLLVSNRISSVKQEIDRSMERLSQLELDRVRLEGEVRQGQMKLDTLTERLRSLNQAGIQGARRTENPAELQPEDYRRLMSERVTLEVNLSGLIARLSSIRASIASLNERLMALPQIQLQLDELETRSQIAKRDLIQLRDRYQEADVRASGVSSEVRVISSASVPLRPSSPVKIYHVGLTAVLSFVTACALVYVLTFFNIRIFFHSLGVAARAVPHPISGPGSEDPAENRERRRNG